MRPTAVLLFLGVAVSAAAPLLAQPFQVASSGTWTTCGITTPFIMDQAEFVFPDPPAPDMERTDRTLVDDVRTLVDAGNDRVFAQVGDSAIVRLSADGSSLPFFAGIPDSFIRGLAAVPGSRVFLTLGGTGGSRLAVVSSAGTLEAVHPLPVTPNGAVLGVAADGCTVHYATHTVIGRINGCTGALLSDFAAVPDATDIEPQPNGDVLVSIADRVLLYSAAGTLLRTVATISSYPGLDRVAFQEVALADGVLWISAGTVCRNGAILRVSFSTGAEVGARIEHLFSVGEGTGLVVGRAHSAAAPIPTAGEWALMLLTLALAAGGASVLRLR